MAIAWLVFPLVLLAVCGGCGLLVERVAGGRLPGALLPSVGLALLIVIALLTTYRRFTIDLTTPLVLVLAAAGYATSWPRLRGLRIDGWAAAVGLGLFAVFAAPVVLSGQPTWLGYFFLNDTAVHFSLIDQLFTGGSRVSGLEPSSYQAIVHAYLDSGYPIGTHVGLGAIRPLVGEDVAWVFQPYLAFILALNGVAMHHLISRVVRSRAMTGACAFIAAQPGLLYAYYLQDSIKELGTVWIMSVTVAVVFVTLDLKPGLRRLVPLAIVVAAGVDILNLAIAPWLGPPLAVAALALVWQRRHAGARGWLLPLVGLAAVSAALAAPALSKSLTFVSIAAGVLTNQADFGNLVRPLEWWQAFGIWPQGDFRFQLVTHQQIAFALMGVTVASSALGTLWMIRRRALGPLLLVGTSAIAALYITRKGSVYANGKTLAVASPAILLAAVLGPAALRDANRRIEAWLLAGVIAAGVLWTNALGYHDASLAARGRFQELASIDDRFHGRGPAFYNQFEDFATHFGRKLDMWTPAFSVVDLRPHLQGRPPALAKYPYDVNDAQLAYVERFPLIVLGRSPFASRPPANYRKVYLGRYYEVWQRGGVPQVVAHVPVGRGHAYVFPTSQAGGMASCDELRPVARLAAGKRAQLAYVERPTVPTVVPTAVPRPPDWGLVESDPYSLIPRGPSGAVTASVAIRQPGRYTVWLQGTLDRRFSVWINGKRVGSAGPYQLGPPAQFISVGHLSLVAGRVNVAIVRPGNGVSPGEGGTTRLLGPLVLDPPSDTREVRYLAPSAYRQLCNKRLDWVEIVR
jgi:hypothetical protein